ncbi:uncharacterized protein with von Willebrand factor type A (vWA) domain [Actinocorallia herbida]|uniref:Uncharacterized protein with von Willebrand factor type A (VWA) domain n=1 Tax=Actinocorallia herbida TaxID=58109 RepID=A0A3N1CNC2_9ACTN|nr:hypothetical protein [Actinocorallia herbida]ROO82783.1 uncharacterized protein with von Willebrand factor type A (vWA) domain [Actinocorallia herbida]
MRYRYGPYREGPDPLAPPFDVREALDAVGDDVMNGSSVSDALRRLMRRGAGEDRRGLDDLLREVRARRRELRERGRLDGVLEEARALLDTAIGQERAELFPDPSDEARLREAELDQVPSDTAAAVRALRDYEWRSDAARQTFQRLKDMLRDDVLDAQFQGLKQALQGGDPAQMERVRDMMAALNAMLDADARGEHRQEDFDAFMAEYGEFFPDTPQTLEELVDSLARRSAAMNRLMNSLSPEQRDELAQLMAESLQDAGLEAEMARLGDALRGRRPDLDWTGGERMTGEDPLGLGDATSALADLADLADLEAAMRQDYPGASLTDVDEEAVRRALGRNAVDDLAELRRIENELQRQGYLSQDKGRLELTPKAVRRLGDTALRRAFSQLAGGPRGDHAQRDAGQAGELTGTSRPWRFGDEQPLDVVRTVTNAVLRDPSHIALTPDDFAVHETENRTAAAVCLLVDLSYSMVSNGTWAAAKQTALALHTLVKSRFPRDAVQIVGFSNYARPLTPEQMTSLDWDMVQGTNLHHALLLAGRHLDAHPDFDPIVMIVTDGEPTAHVRPDGRYLFDYPPSPETLVLTFAEVDKMTRRGATLNVFMLADEPRLIAFVDEIAHRNGGRVFTTDADSLSVEVVSDYLSTRTPRRSRR